MADTLKNHDYFGIDATIIADSKNEFGKRLTTFVVTFPRIVLAEFNTHRMLSRNSASSRAVPFETMLERVGNNPFIPIRWMKNHKGMQGQEYMDERESKDATLAWLASRNRAMQYAGIMGEMGVTKQIINRMLEPWMWHTCIVTATEWENFYALRAEAGAEIHIQKLAYVMLEAHNASTPKQLKAGEWHIPFGDTITNDRLWDTFTEEKPTARATDQYKIKIATARCARVSYINFEGKDDYRADVKLHDRLSKLAHWSPFEHCAKANDKGYPVGNFIGFTQYRKSFNAENKNDQRLLP